MIKYVQWFCLLLAFPLFCQSKEVEGLSFYSHILHKEIGYSIVLPSDYDKSHASYPVLYMLHGLGDNAQSWIEYGSIGQKTDQMVQQNKISPFIIVTPQGDSDYYADFYDGSYNYRQMFVQELVPYIDQHYRTLPLAKYRAVSGYSMGGFGALMLPLLHPDIFSVSLPLSPSIRTHEQYIKEGSQQGWNHQWGRIFGGTDSVGLSRLTPYYQKNSPFSFIENQSREELEKISFFIETGDQEQTLCRSNEELHQLLLDKGVKHHYRVKEGGHSFEYWRSTLDDLFRYADGCFHSRPFVPSGKNHSLTKACAESQPIYWKSILTQEGKINLCYGQNPDLHLRKYPVIYITGSYPPSFPAQIATYYTNEYAKGTLPAMVLCFVPSTASKDWDKEIIPCVEKQGQGRAHRRYRAIWQIKGDGVATIRQFLTPDLFTAFALTDVTIPLSAQEIEKTVLDSKESRHTLRGFMQTSSCGKTYSGNGSLHIALQEAGFEHQYRAYPFEIQIEREMPDILNFISKRIHH